MSRNCRSAVTKVFPDICPDYLQSVAKPLGFDPDKVINRILDRQESGKPYKSNCEKGKAKPTHKTAKANEGTSNNMTTNRPSLEIRR